MIHFNAVWKRYSKELFRRTQPALQELTFTLSPGRTLGLIGANGAGKSTAIRLMMDFIRPTSGTITLFGKNPSEVSNRKKIGYLPETASFPANLNIYDLIRYTGITCGIPSATRRERGEALLHELGLWQARKRPLRSFSKGMQQRANFILALLNDPELLILDEPMSGLDPLGREQISSLIHRLKTEGKTILFCSHILSDVDRLVDELMVLHKGVNLFSGSPRAFMEVEDGADLESAFLNLLKRNKGDQDAA